MNSWRIRASVYLLATSFCLVANRATAQDAVEAAPYVWRNVTVGGGGFIPGIVFSRAEKGLVYLRSDMGGFYRWDALKQRWLPLNDAMAQSSYQGGESVAPDPVNPNVVYLAAGMYRWEPSAMMRSRDRGRTWQIFPVSFKMGGNEDGRGMGERLAVDPNSTNILMFGSRHNGLMRSQDYAQNWSPVDSFPNRGLGEPPRGSPETHGGLSFVVFDPHSAGQRDSNDKSPSRTIFVGSTDPGSAHLFRTDDAGQTWTSVSGGPNADWVPLQAQIDDQGRLFLTYSDSIGPNGVSAGGVFVLDTHSGLWTDITPGGRQGTREGGYCGLSLDRQHPGTLAVATLDRWHRGDTVFRTTDGGATWSDIAPMSQRDVSATPFLLWGNKQTRLGWWMAALAIDPFDSNHAAYGTGATIYATHDFSNVSHDQPTHWSPWVTGIEQTAIITLCSPSAGPPLLSGFGDIVGFVHDDLDKSPRGGFYQPTLGNTVMIDYAPLAPNVLVRAGDAAEANTSAAFSEDSGQTWQVISTGPAAERGRRSRGRMPPAIAVSADGRRFILTTDHAMLTTDRGASWTAVQGLPRDCRPIADRMNPQRFYSFDFATGQFFGSVDGGRRFAPLASQGLPADTAADRSIGPSWPLQAAPGKEGDLWYCGKAGLFHSLDGGKTFSQVQSDVRVRDLSFGKPAPGRAEPALFAIGSLGQLTAIFRSDDSGQSWIRLNDDQHQWGRRFRCICGDPRIFGRVYVGTDGRAILYGTPKDN
jgi:xyloglucan-specific exo-beta-1,4-glucanase